MSEQDRKGKDKLFEALRKTCFKPTDYYLNLFYSRALNPENTKNFLESLSDKTWGELITIFENQVDYKSVVPGQFSQEIVINRVEQRQGSIRNERKFTGVCNYCNKSGYKWAECRKRMEDAERQQITLKQPFQRQMKSGILSQNLGYQRNSYKSKNNFYNFLLPIF
ncbi:hypothetical protein BpHYR1_006452 [Brachionus plicatilis]|uniref:Uncharacterized protein n=1 Tax=Brachionus plicatilis TaxID=10195 RepID=A0A3M7Q0D3_BRAPC|nr:hypothetical protein BpHYR1_006452 [Brachionus plicatilis]